LKFAEAEAIEREMLAVKTRVLGAEDPSTLGSTSNLASYLSRQGNYADAERIQRELLTVQKRVCGAEHPYTLHVADNLAVTLQRRCKYTEAEALQREVLGLRKRVLGSEHPETLKSLGNLANSLRKLGKSAESDAMERELLGVQKRVLGAEHPDTLTTSYFVAMSLADRGQYAEAEQMLHAALASFQRVLGPTHPDTLQTADRLETMRLHMRAATRANAKPPVSAAAPAAAGTTRPLPAGTRVLVQRLVAKPEHNGKLARVVSFDLRTGRYAVLLDDGKELSLKAECVEKAGCAAAGCASEEASSMCGRCEAVRYCSRECQRRDWKAHKPVCAAAQP
jgi:tetratricopeptide (TPR) repeat protein